VSYWQRNEKESEPGVVEVQPQESLRQETAQLYASSREGVIRFLITGGLNPHAAEEAAQEAFLRLYQARRDGEEIEQPRSWVYRVARNVAFNSLRNGKRHSGFSEALEDAIADGRASVEQDLMERQSLEAFREAIKNLSERQRLCLELRSQGLQFREISEILNIRISTAAEFVRRGIEELKKWNRQKA
jgi:RNA polymerase sigma-70 factor (ECF subfamily)